MMKTAMGAPLAVMEMPSKAHGALKLGYADKRNEEMNDDEIGHKKVFEALVQQANAQYRSAMRLSDSITERDVREYEMHNLSDDGWKRIGANTYEERMKMVRQDIDQYIPELIEVTRTLESMFYSKLNNAIEKGWINRDSSQEWIEKLKSGDVQHFTKAEFIKETFPKFLENWKEVAEKREDVIKLAQEHKLSSRDIPELATILNQDAFLSLHYLTRKDRVAEAKALILAHAKNKTRFLSFIQKELKDWAAEGIMHKCKIGEWMERVMESDDPEAFASTVLYPFKKNWEAVREDFDRLHAAMDAQGIPRGFRPVKTDKFLMMNYKQRTSYVSLAWIRLDNAAESDKKLASLKLRIRYNLDTKDYEGAQEDLDIALRLRAGDPELGSMVEYIQCHREEEKNADEQKEDASPLELNQSIKQMLQHIEGDAYQVYAWAAESGLRETEALQTMMYNLVWSHENNYTSEKDDLERGEDDTNKMKTQTYVKDGHSKDVEFIILEGDTATAQAVRGECTTAQVLYVGGSGTGALKEAIHEHAGKEDVKYWTSIKFKSLAFARHNRIVKDLHQPLKTQLRQLDRMGYRFSLSGEPQPKAGAKQGMPHKKPLPRNKATLQSGLSLAI